MHVEDGKAVKIEGDPNHPLNAGYMCPKGLSFLQLEYHLDRLKYPLKRVGAKGSGEWKRITWEEALSEISGELLRIRDQYGLKP